MPEPRPGPPRIVPAPEPRPPRRWRWALLAACVVGLAGGLYLLLRPGQVPTTGSTNLIQSSPAASAPQKRALRLSGQTAAVNSATISVPRFRGPDSGSELTLMNVAAAGSFVKKGSIVAEFDPQALQDHIDDVSDIVRQADNDILKRKADQEVEWESLQQSLRVAKAEADKAQLDLKAAEVKTDLERELLKIAADESEAAYKQLQKDVANTQVAQQAELRMLQITAMRHRIHLGRHTHDLAKFKIRAPMSGLVVMLQAWRSGEMRQIREGDQVRPGQPFMKIVDVSSMQIEALTSQADSTGLRVGQIAEIGLDAFPQLRFRGRIEAIGALAVKGIWDTYYIRNIPVSIAIEGHDPRLIPDLSAWAEITEPALAPATASQGAAL
jgi:HlyD family secretion protein